VDSIVLGVPNHLHAPMAISALEAGVHVMVEKPMAVNAAEAKRMLDVSERNIYRLIRRYGLVEMS